MPFVKTHKLQWKKSGKAPKFFSRPRNPLTLAAGLATMKLFQGWKRFRYRYRAAFPGVFYEREGFRVTIKDIAKACGVSVSTVSRVLNQRPDVSEAVRGRVLEEVRRSGFLPNDSARDLVRSRSDAVGVVVRGTGNLFFSDILRTISEELDRRGYTMVLRLIDSEADEIKAGAMLEREKKLRGLLFLGGRFDYRPAETALIGVPFVCCSYTNCFGSLEEGAYSSVSIDDRETARQAVKTLLDLGHRRIAALVPGCADHSISELRFKGYLAALEEQGLAFDPALLEETGGFDMPEAYEGLCRLLERGGGFTALFALSDTAALAAVKALQDHGRRVPEDCSVIAIDGLRVSEYANPTLTTMVQPAAEIGRESVRILLDCLENGAPARHLRLEARLRRGGSVAPR